VPNSETASAHTFLSADEASALLDNASDVLLRASLDGDFEWVSQSVVDVLGFTPAQLIGTPVFDLVHPDDVQQLNEYQHGTEAGQPQRFELRLRHSDGTYRWVATYVRPNLDRQGQLIGRTAAWRDINDEVVARELAVQALAHLRAALDTMPDPYAVIAAIRNADGEIDDFVCEDVNVAACRFMGQPKAELTTMRCSDYKPERAAAAYIRSLRQVLDTGETLVVDRALNPDGSNDDARYFDARAARIDADHVGFTWRDVTTQVEHERTRSELRAMAALADERDSVARDLHDGAIQHVYATGMLLHGLLPQVPDDVRAQLERVIDAHDDIIRELRATILGLVRPEIEQLAPSVLFERVVVEAERGVGFVPRLTFDGPVDELDDPVLLQHIMFSLREMLSNVARHAGATMVEVTVGVDDRRVVIEVADNGVGSQPGSSGGYGLSNLTRRAELLDGWFSLAPRMPAGTVAHWEVARHRSHH
jgi:PAS domain S-box-containing protein